MDITALPFNAHIGIARVGQGDSCLCLKFDDRLTNHLGTLHASALFALAEATSGEFLLQSRGDRTDIGGVVRRATTKYSRPANGDVFSKVTTPVTEIETAISKVDSRGKSLVDIDVELVDMDSAVIGRFSFTWMLASE